MKIVMYIIEKGKMKCDFIKGLEANISIRFHKKIKTIERWLMRSKYHTLIHEVANLPNLHMPFLPFSTKLIHYYIYQLILSFIFFYLFFHIYQFNFVFFISHISNFIDFSFDILLLNFNLNK